VDLLTCGHGVADFQQSGGTTNFGVACCVKRKTIIIDISTIKLLFLAADVIWGTSQRGTANDLSVDERSRRRTLPRPNVMSRRQPGTKVPGQIMTRRLDSGLEASATGATLARCSPLV